MGMIAKEKGDFPISQYFKPMVDVFLNKIFSCMQLTGLNAEIIRWDSRTFFYTVGEMMI